MAWAVAYSATILALAYAIPRALAIWAQFRLMQDQIKALAVTDVEATGVNSKTEWPDPMMFDGGGYA